MLLYAHMLLLYHERKLNVLGFSFIILNILRIPGTLCDMVTWCRQFKTCKSLADNNVAHFAAICNEIKKKTPKTSWFHFIFIRMTKSFYQKKKLDKGQKKYCGKKNPFLTFPACFYIPIIFSNLYFNCSNLLDMRNLQEQVKKAFCYQKLF